MAVIQWDQTGKRLYETGVDHGVLYAYDTEANEYSDGEAWNGLTTITKSPSGAEPTPIYADNIKYLNLMSVEEFGFTIEAFTYPDSFALCDGTAEPVEGVSVSQQNRRTFGLSYRTLVGNDVKGTDYGYKIHLIWGALASPSEKAAATVNDTPEAATMSWTASTSPISFPAEMNLKPTSSIVVDSTKIDAAKLTALEAVLYGSETDPAKLPLPSEVIALLNA